MTEKRISLTRRSALKNGAIATGALFVGGTAASGTAVAGIGDGRVADYHLNNLHYNVDKGVKTRDHVHDASTEKNHGKWKNNEDDPVVDGAVGNAFAFNGDDIINLGSTPSLNNLGTFTIAAWVRPDTDNYERWARVFAIGGEENAINLGRHRENEKPFVHFVDSNGDGHVVSAGGFANDTWTHIAGTWDGTLSLYQDGDMISDSNLSEKSVIAYDTDSWIGDRPFGGHENGWAGRIDEARIYDRALDGNEIQDLVDMKD